MSNDNRIYLTREEMLKLSGHSGKNACGEFMNKLIATYELNVNVFVLKKEHPLVVEAWKDAKRTKTFNAKLASMKHCAVTRDVYDELVTRAKIRSKRPKKTTVREKDVSDRLALELNGEREVLLTDSKRIDVLTGAEVIEVKSYKSMLSAVGQIVYYGMEFPRRSMRIHIFNHHGKRDRKYELMCEALDITVSYEP